MGLLGKKGVETIDYTLLQKKGFIKKTERVKPGFKVDSAGMIDLTSTANNSIPPVSTDNSNSNPFGFLDSLAQSSSSTSDNLSSSGYPSTSNIQSDGVEMNALKIKIDDLEYKLSQLLEKLSLVESKMGKFEEKIIG